MEFKPKIETVHSVHNGKKIETLTFFPCAACSVIGTVEEDLGLCRPCWRLVVMIGEIARELRGETAKPKRQAKAFLIQRGNVPSAPNASAPQDSPVADAASGAPAQLAKARETA